MRTFRFIGMAIIAILFSVNFTACSSDDDEVIKDDDGVVTNQKKLVEVKMTDNGETYTGDFSYDSKGRLASVIQTEEDYYDIYESTTNYTWGNNIIMEKEERNTKTYTLENNLIRTIKILDDGYSSNESFTYNSSKQLLTVEEDDEKDTSIKTYTWEDGKITKLNYHSYDNYESIDNYTYSGKTCKGYFPPISFAVNNLVMLVHPELAGIRVTQLPTQSYSKEVQKDEHYDDYFKETYKYENIDEETIKYTYKLTDDGYVESVTAEETDIETNKYSFQDKNGDGKISDDERNITNTRTSTSTAIYTFKWE